MGHPEPKGVVQRWDFTGEVPKLLHRTRDTALFSGAEWGWSTNADDAWQFDTFNADRGATYENDATAHVAKLRAEGAEAVYPRVICAHEAQERLLQERRQRHADAVAQAEASAAPAVEPSGRESKRIVNGRFAKKVGKHAAAARRRAASPPPEEVFEREERRHLA